MSEEYCCQKFKEGVESKEILWKLYPSGKEYYRADDEEGNYLPECPFCGEYFI